MQELHQYYELIKKSVQDGNVKNIKMSQLQKMQKKADAQLQKTASSGIYTDLDAYSFYKEQFTQIENVFKRAKKDSYPKAQLQEELKKTIRNGTLKPKISEREEIVRGDKRENESMHINQSQRGSGRRNNTQIQSMMVSSNLKQFFKQKHSQLRQGQKKNLYYQPPSLDQYKIKRKKLNESMNELEYLKEKLNREENSNEELRREISNLELKIQTIKNQKLGSIREELEEQFSQNQVNYAPYLLKIRENNINKINQTNSKRSQKMTQFRSNCSDLFRDNNARSRSDYNMIQSSNISYNESTKSLNKIAYFKKSMTIINQQDLSISFNKSNLQGNLDRQTINILIKNKSRNEMYIKINYIYQTQYFDVKVIHQLKKIQSQCQNKEEVVVRFLNKDDLDSVIQMNLTINGNTWNLLLPVMFIQFQQTYHRNTHQYQNNTYQNNFDPQTYNINQHNNNLINLKHPYGVYPIAQFKTIELAEKVIPLNKMWIDKSQVGFIEGKSKIHSGTIKFLWNHTPKKIVIDTDPKWTLFIGFLTVYQR